MNSLDSQFLNSTSQDVYITLAVSGQEGYASYSDPFKPNVQKSFNRQEKAYLYNLRIYSSPSYSKENELASFCVGDGSVLFYQDQDGNYRASDNLAGGGVSYGPYPCPLSSPSPSSFSKAHSSASLAILILLILAIIFLGMRR